MEILNLKISHMVLRKRYGGYVRRPVQRAVLMSGRRNCQSASFVELMLVAHIVHQIIKAPVFIHLSYIHILRSPHSGILKRMGLSNLNRLHQGAALKYGGYALIHVNMVVNTSGLHVSLIELQLIQDVLNVAGFFAKSACINQLLTHILISSRNGIQVKMVI
jgi:hypothetical protein